LFGACGSECIWAILHQKNVAWRETTSAEDKLTAVVLYKAKIPLKAIRPLPSYNRGVETGDYQDVGDQHGEQRLSEGPVHLLPRRRLEVNQSG
jgi:hypothetical protein